jgi:tyrosyl-tRNA synthetase
MARQGGLYVNKERVTEDRVISERDVDGGAILLRAGKKKYRKVVLQEDS